MIKEKHWRLGTIVMRAAFASYIVVMLWLLFGQRIGGITGDYGHLADRINLIPFQTVRRYLALAAGGGGGYWWRHAIINLAGNILLFIPLGFLMPCVLPQMRRFWRTFLVSAVVLTAVELIQLFTLLGSCDIDDLLLNLLGSSIGYMLFYLWRRVARLMR